MSQSTAVMNAVEALGYRVTVGDVAARAGIDLALAQQGVNALAADTQAHLQVSESGEVAYEFPKNFRAILRSKYLRIRLQEAGARIWRILFYLIRISFGILLLVSILIILIAIVLLLIALSSSRRDDDSRSDWGGGGLVLIPRFWIGDLFWFFDFDPSGHRRLNRDRPQRSSADDAEKMGFLEAVFSFLFGDGNPNADLEERRWQTIGAVIQNNGGVVTAEQILPYLDVEDGQDPEDEDFMLPVLLRFNGVPQVSPAGHIIYQFPELQVTARDRSQVPVPAYLKESPWRFSRARGGQIAGAIGLGAVNFVGALLLGALLQDPALVQQAGSFVVFVSSIYWLLLGYGTAFLAVPALRYLWVQRQNQHITRRNEARQQRAVALNQAGPDVQAKLAFAQQFAAQTVIDQTDLAYTTAKDLTEQEFEQREKLDAEWQKRLDGAQESDP